MNRTLLGPRVVIAGTHSGVGKTTVATGLMAALRHAGDRPAAAKVGPDFIDPGYHSLATGRPPRNLDAWLCGPEAMAPLCRRAGENADILVIEGVMGLFDGANDGGVSSTADVARLLGAPVVLVVDASAMAGSVAATVHGFATWDPVSRVEGVILNRVGSPTHEALLREALEGSGVAVLGALGRDDRLTWRDRHLGLVPVAEDRASVEQRLDILSHVIATSVDLAGIRRIAAGAAQMSAGAVNLPPQVGSLRVGVASGAAFNFTYTDTIDALVAAGAEIIPFDPLFDPALPVGIDGLLVGGGFPEVYAGQLADNERLLADLRHRVTAGLTTWAECGGLLLLCRSLDGRPMAGVVPTDGALTTKLTLGYRNVLTRRPSPVGPTNTAWRGHEFHYSAVEPGGDALALSSRWGTGEEGWATPSLLATYVHHHPGGDPAAIEQFVMTCRANGMP
ncbi:MAG: cobyrinate a,c-diamide synthase [Actinomycetota bacterium]|nr:cobyrinate a,c-diamide synthase [Actinomycetota bacterium]